MWKVPYIRLLFLFTYVFTGHTLTDNLGVLVNENIWLGSWSVEATSCKGIESLICGFGYFREHIKKLFN